MVAVFRLVVIVVAVVVAVVANCFHHKCMYSVDQWGQEPVAVVKASALQAAADFTGRCTHLRIPAILALPWICSLMGNETWLAQLLRGCS